MAFAPNDIWTALGTLLVGGSISVGAAVTWLRRNKVDMASARSDVATIESKDAAIKAWQELYESSEQRTRDANERAKIAEARADELLAQARADRAEYLRQSRIDRQADRAEIEKLSQEVHQLRLKVTDLTAENKALKENVAELSGRIGARQPS